MPREERLMTQLMISARNKKQESEVNGQMPNGVQ